MILLLTGAKKNVGDYLITHRARALLESVLAEEVVTVPAWEPLAAAGDDLERARAIVIGGGPGLQPTLYPNIYPLGEPGEVLALGKPLVFLGSGCSLPTGDQRDIELAEFSSQTRALFKTLGDLISFSARDSITMSVLERNRIDGATFTGCPVWYRLDRLGQEFLAPDDIQKIVFTTPADVRHAEQSAALLESIVARFAGATIYCVFHRGIRADMYTSPMVAQYMMALAHHASGIGCKVVDASYDLSRIAFYDDCDLHVGYRVHAHLYFLSARRPSILVEEDSRGLGASKALGIPGVRAWQNPATGYSARKVRAGAEAEELAARRRDKQPSPSAASEAMALVDRHVDEKFAAYESARQAIDDRYETMVEFVRSI